MKPLAILYLDSTAYFPTELLERVATVRLIELEQEHDALSILIPWFVQEDTATLPVNIKRYIERYLESKISTIPIAHKKEEMNRKQLIQSILFKNQELGPNDRADIDHVFEAQTYRAVFFVTCDRNTLSKAPLLFKHFKLQVMSPSRCLHILEDYLLKDGVHYTDLFKNHP